MNKEPRGNEAEAVVGFKQTGKSYYMNKRAVAYPKHKKVLIYDSSFSPVFAPYKTVNTKTLFSGRWKSGIIKYECENADEVMTNIASFAKDKKLNPTGILLIIDDATKYIPANPDQTIKNLIIDHRKYNADILYGFHSFIDVPPFLRRNVHYFTIKKTADNFDQLDKMNLMNKDKMIAAWLKVMKSDIRYTQITVPTGL